MPSESSVRPVSHDPYLDIEILLPPFINKTAPTFIGTVPCRLIEKDLNLIVIHDDLIHQIVDEHLGFKSQGLLMTIQARRNTEFLRAALVCLFYSQTNGYGCILS